MLSFLFPKASRDRTSLITIKHRMLKHLCFIIMVVFGKLLMPEIGGLQYVGQKEKMQTLSKSEIMSHQTKIDSK